MNEELYHELEIVVKATFFFDFLVSRSRTFGSDGFSVLVSGLFLFKIVIVRLIFLRQMLPRNVILSNVAELASSLSDNIREKNVSWWHLTVVF